MGKHFLVNESLCYNITGYAEKNYFIKKEFDGKPLPEYESSKDKLPIPVWDGHDDAIECYYKTWQIAFSNLRLPNREAGFVSSFIDTAFNGYLFMWDSSFIVMFGRYGSRAFNFQQTLDNFYSHQHLDGFICREICEDQPGEQWQRDDPVSTGPNILPWSEWEYFKSTGDVERLRKIFNPLMGYHRWLYLNRSWPDGGYWSSGLACGMDNMPRHQPGYNCALSHGHMTWIDTCIQMVISGKVLIEIGKIIGREPETDWLKDEVKSLTDLINNKLWSEKDSFYFDRWKNGQLSGIKNIGAYWALLADIVPADRLDKFVEHLNNKNEFNRPHRIPTLAADQQGYDPTGGYWHGAVWAPTNYMVLKGLEKNGYDDLAYEIACNHLDNVVKVFNETGTVWENYMPESANPGKPAKSDFVGWTGLVPICVLLEFVLGIKPYAQNKKIVWNINRTERHGVSNYPLGEATVELICQARKSADEEPSVEIHSTSPITVEIHWAGKVKTITA